MSNEEKTTEIFNNLVCVRVSPEVKKDLEKLAFVHALPRADVFSTFCRDLIYEMIGENEIHYIEQALARLNYRIIKKGTPSFRKKGAKAEAKEDRKAQQAGMQAA